MGWLFGTSGAAGTLAVGRTYRCDFVVAAIGITGPSGREMVYDAAGYVEPKPGDPLDVENAIATLRSEAIDACRAELPGASDYRIISESKLREV